MAPNLQTLISNVPADPSGILGTAGFAIAVHEDGLFYIGPTAGSIRRLDLTKSVDQEILPFGAGGISGLAPHADSGTLYFIDEDDDQINSVPLGGDLMPLDPPTLFGLSPPRVRRFQKRPPVLLAKASASLYFLCWQIHRSFQAARRAFSTWNLSQSLEVCMREGLCRRAFGVLIIAIGVVATGAGASPIVPGYDHLKQAGRGPAALGELLLGELNCVSCHQAPVGSRLQAAGAPDLTGVGARITPQYLRAYLTRPHTAKPGATMPDLFHASMPHARDGAVDFLVHYFISQSGPIAPASEEGNTSLVEQGRDLYHSVGCVACHAPEKQIESTPVSIPLGNLALKTTVDRLGEFLVDPHKTRPSGRMPASGLSRSEARAIAVYLLRDQLDNPQAGSALPPRNRGLRYSYYEASVTNVALETFDSLEPIREGTLDRIGIDVPGRRGDRFAIRFTGIIAIARDGEYTFYTASDDGSRLYIDGELIVDNDAEQGTTEKSGKVFLKAGDHPIAVTYYERAGGEALYASWRGPGFAKQRIPPDVFFNIGGTPMIPLQSEAFTVDPQKAEMGRQMFALLGCASCHNLSGTQSLREAKPLAALDPARGCLSETVDKSMPNYRLSDDQRQAMQAALRDLSRLSAPLEAREQVLYTMAAMNCFACHEREKIGGPASGRAEFFTMVGEFDMGEEGRIPPRLTGAGAKLRPEALQKIIFERKLHVRPVLATRMPQFKRERMVGFVEALAKADLPGTLPPEPMFSDQGVRDGRLLVGVKGLGCVNCHGVAGAKSLGMPAPDLATAYERIRPHWFGELLVNPAEKNPDTRMPQFWADDIVSVKGAGGETRDGQIEAIWAYLSLGKSMPLPAGLSPTNGFELVPTDEPIIHRTFMADVGTRAILVGFADNVHVAFDANGMRLAKAWRGRFFDTKGMWEGRGGGRMGPLGTGTLNMPAGPALAFLSTPSAAWPEIRAGQRNIGGRFRGYRLDKLQRPTFIYTLGDVEIQEQPLPVLKAGGAQLERRFMLRGAAAESGMYFLAAAGSKIEAKSDEVWLVDDRLTVRLSAPGRAAIVRDSGGGKQLLLPITFTNNTASFTVEMSW